MTYGFLALNNNNEVLISSETRNLHFVGKAYLDRTIKAFDYYGGLRHWAFRIACNVTPVPFFTMPTSDFYAVAAVRNAGGNVWEIEVIRSGTADSVPEVYIFADPRGFSSARDSTHGMQVMAEDGSLAFDSRLKPLIVTGGTNVTHPSNPRPAFPYGLNPKNCNSSTADSGGMFAPDQWNTTSIPAVPAKAMYSFPSLAQAERQATYSASEEECDGGTVKGNCVGVQRNYSWTSTYWAFYRGGIRMGGNTQLQSGWLVVSFGCNWTYAKDSAFIGVGTGGDSGDGGSWPYSNETINLTAASVIISNASLYD